jgi:hypothetical protein
MGLVAVIVFLIVTQVVVFAAARAANEVAQNKGGYSHDKHHRNFGNVYRREQNGESNRLQVLHENDGKQNADDKDDDGFDAHKFLPLIGYHNMQF